MNAICFPAPKGKPNECCIHVNSIETLQPFHVALVSVMVTVFIVAEELADRTVRYASSTTPPSYRKNVAADRLTKPVNAALLKAQPTPCQRRPKSGPTPTHWDSVPCCPVRSWLVRSGTTGALPRWRQSRHALQPADSIALCTHHSTACRRTRRSPALLEAAQGARWS